MCGRFHNEINQILIISSQIRCFKITLWMKTFGKMTDSQTLINLITILVVVFYMVESFEPKMMLTFFLDWFTMMTLNSINFKTKVISSNIQYGHHMIGHQPIQSIQNSIKWMSLPPHQKQQQWREKVKRIRECLKIYECFSVTATWWACMLYNFSTQ